MENTITRGNGRWGKRGKVADVALWAIQICLALLFVFAGVMKLVMPVEVMTQHTSLPGGFFRFIGVAELYGALGLTLPGALKMRQQLTPLAATGLASIMTGATVLTFVTQGALTALFPLCVLILLSTVVWGRWDSLNGALREPVDLGRTCSIRSRE